MMRWRKSYEHEEDDETKWAVKAEDMFRVYADIDGEDLEFYYGPDAHTATGVMGEWIKMFQRQSPRDGRVQEFRLSVHRGVVAPRTGIPYE